MILRPEQEPGAWANRSGWSPSAAWPADCQVQWGDRGLVFDHEGGHRTTAFFEAFPTDPPTFIRGEGATVPLAEQAAWAQFARQAACPGHTFTRAGYRNGAGLCSGCGLFASGIFEVLPDAPDRAPGLLERVFSGDLTAALTVLDAWAETDPAVLQAEPEPIETSPEAPAPD
jgi:hypothetical protein